MSRTITLIRPCLGLVTRIECEIKPLGQEQGLWTLLCAAGIFRLRFVDCAAALACPRLSNAHSCRSTPSPASISTRRFPCNWRN